MKEILYPYFYYRKSVHTRNKKPTTERALKGLVKRRPCRNLARCKRGQRRCVYGAGHIGLVGYRSAGDKGFACGALLLLAGLLPGLFPCGLGLFFLFGKGFIGLGEFSSVLRKGFFAG